MILIETVSGKRIVCDPYAEGTGYAVPGLEADIVTVSHGHFDHSAVDTLKGDLVVIKSEGVHEAGGFKISGTGSWHDSENGQKLGPNIIFRIEADNISLVHMGDVGEVISREKADGLRPCDILVLPVGGFFTIGASEAIKTAGLLNPQVVIPVHYHTPSCAIGLNDAEGFISGFLDVRRVKEWNGDRNDLPRSPVVFALKALGEGPPLP